MLPPLFFSSQFPLKNKTRRRIYHVIWDFFYISPKFYNLAKKIILTAVRIYLLLKKKKKKERKKKMSILLFQKTLFFWAIYHIQATIGLEKEMATHSSILACKIPWTEEPGGL